MSIPYQPQQMEEQPIVELTTVVDVSANKKKRPSIMEVIKEKQNSQDFNQKLNVAITLILEIYRVLMGAFLKSICRFSNIARYNCLSVSESNI